MAQIHEEYVVVKLSKLVRNSGETIILTDEIMELLTGVVEQTVTEIMDGQNVLVEVEKGA